MPRGITGSLETATLAEALTPVLMFEGLFDSYPIRFWSGLGEITWNGVSWTGSGTLLSISDVQETAEIKATGVDVLLSGVPSDLISLALLEPYQGRIATLYFGAFDASTGGLIADPYLLFSGRMDVMTISDGADTGSISLSIESRLIDLEVARERRYENQDQKVDWPNDRFFEFTSSLVDAEIKWGRT
jgi:hypothetical protein